VLSESIKDYVDGSGLEKQAKLDIEDKCGICGSTTDKSTLHPRCVNCNVRICINHWNQHKTEVHMKDISSFRNTVRQITAIDDCLDFKTCVKYMFKRL
jgi:hypothetical protein